MLQIPSHNQLCFFLIFEKISWEVNNFSPFIITCFFRLHPADIPMKKILTALVLLLALVIACIYVFIPRKLVVSEGLATVTNDEQTFKFLMNEAEWRKWWHKDQLNANDPTFEYSGVSFKPDSLFYNRLNIKIHKDDYVIDSKLHVIPAPNDSSHLAWECIIDAGNNPFTRWQHYRTAVLIKKSMDSVLAHYRSWIEIPKNVYGFEVTPSRIIDTLLIAKRVSFRTYPSTQQVDTVVKYLQSYAIKNGARISGYPMLNIINKEDGVHEAQIAQPIDKVVPETTDIGIRRMVPGNTLIVKLHGGGNYTISKAYEACESYKDDHHHTSPAIPFQSMITNRVDQPDTSKWETIIYYPVK